MTNATPRLIRPPATSGRAAVTLFCTKVPMDAGEAGSTPPTWRCTMPGSARSSRVNCHTGLHTGDWCNIPVHSDRLPSQAPDGRGHPQNF